MVRRAARQRAETVRLSHGTPSWRRVVVALCLYVTLIPFTAGETAHEHETPAVLAPGYGLLEFTPPAAGSYQLPSLGIAADGELLDERGRPVSLAELLDGRVTVLSFIYTRCGEVNGCPLASYVLQGVQERVAQDERLISAVQLISISFDPRHDTPAVVNRYGSAFRMNGIDWRFLTTAGEETLTPLLAAYDQSVVEDYDEKGNFLGSMSHILRVFLIDAERRVRNIYSVSYLHADTLTNDIRTVLMADS